MPEIVKINVLQNEMDGRRALIESCHRLENSRTPVHLFCDSPFYCRLSGIAIEEIYRGPEAMLRAQIFGWKKILEQIDCDVPEIPVGLDFGSCLTASAYGCEIARQPGSVPGFHPWFRGEKDLSRLESIDILKSGMRARMLDYWQSWRGKLGHTYMVCFDGGIPFHPAGGVRLPDCSDGPFTIACMISGMDTFCMICLDSPALARRVLDIITEKELERLTHDLALNNGVSEREIHSNSRKFIIGLADDYSPYLSLSMYEEFVLPYQQRLRDAFGDTVRFHSCIPDRKLFRHWRDDLKIDLYNGGKPQGGLQNIKRDYAPVAEEFGGRIVLEPDIDGANVMRASEDDLATAAREFLEVFSGFKGVKLGATLCGGHRIDDLKKLNVLKHVVANTTIG